MEEVDSRPDSSPRGPHLDFDLDSCLITSELSERPSRPPDFEAENRALVSLARRLSSSPEGILEDLAQSALTLCRAHSAGISLLTDDKQSFRWPALVGEWACHRGGGTPRAFGPCGTVLDRNAPLLFSHPERFFSYLAPVTPAVEEALLVPFAVDGENAGTIWVIAHDRSLQFDGEDLRVLTSLAKFASAGFQVLSSRDSHRLTEDTLRRRSAQFETLLNEAPLGVYLVDQDFRICAINPVARAVFGDVPEFIGRDFDEVLHILWSKEYADELVTRFRLTLETGEPYVETERIERRLDRGATEFYEWQISRIPLPHGRFGVVCYFRDISRQVLARRALSESESRLRFMAEAMPQKIFTATPAGEIDYFNSRWMEFTGLTFEQIKNWGWTQFIHPDDVGENIRLWQHSIDTGEPIEFEHRFRRADGVYRWHLSRAHCMVQEDGSRVMWIGSNTDIHDVKEAEEELRAGKDYLRTVLDSSAGGFYGVDRDGATTICNSAFLHMLGFTREEDVIGKNLHDVIHHSRADGSPYTRETCPILRTARTGEPGHVADEQFFRLDGSSVSVEYWSVPIFRQGELKGAVTTFVDISARKELESDREAILVREQAARGEAEAANHSKDVFLATLSHEVRTPLNAILGWAAVLRAKRSSAEELREGLEVIERNCRVQAQLIDDVLDISRIVSGKLRLEMKPCDLDAVIHAALDVVRSAAVSKGVTLEATLDPAAGEAVCDGDRIQQVVWNLLSNAIKFTPSGGRVRIRLARDAAGTVIEVADDGRGIDPEFLPFVFDRFRQAESTSRRRFGGLGLGLSIVKHIVEMHGGTVEVESGGDGAGSTFRVRLPLAPSTPASSDGAGDRPRGGLSPDSNGAAASLDGLNVLVVDDEPDARRLMSKVLAGAGAHVTVAENAAEALRALANRDARTHILISDLGMPNEDGFDLIRHVRDLGYTAEELPAVALSAFANESYARHALAAGFQVHVPKPVAPRDLIRAVARLVGRES